MSSFPLVPRGLSGASYIPILLNEVEKEQRPSVNRDNKAIIVEAGLCDGEGERAYTVMTLQYFRSKHKRSRTVFVDPPFVYQFQSLFSISVFSIVVD